MNPEPIGSVAGAMTIGIVEVAFLAAAMAGVASTTMTSGFRLTISFIISGRIL
jgi:hypothetical protein